MSKRAIVLGMAFVLFIFIGTYVGAFLVIVDDGGENDNQPNDTNTQQQLEFDGDIDKNAVITEMHRLANDERTERGMDGLAQNADLQEVANYKAQKMVNQDYISHESPSGETVKDRFERFSMGCERFGENLAQTHYMTRIDTNYGGFDTYTTEDELAEGVIKQFMASPSHKENILNEQWDTMALSLGINDDGKVYVAQEFCGDR